MPPAVDPTTSHSADDGAGAPSGDRGGTALFRERLLPGVGGWIVAVVLGAVCGVVLVPLSLWLGVAVGTIAAIAACILAAVTSPLLEVRDGRFTMGRARIEVELLGAPEVRRGPDWAQTMGTGFEPLAHHCTRGWIHSGVRLEVLDAQDPITAWVAASRRPDDLALAVRTAQQLSARDA